ncbi:MAG: bifunctional phosphopantothenoylcysteine decarboxylase/phosphopantothenate--cysteine ligase CoaBC [Alphaproteobacteria bacterium]|nr:bifunctional phosphopantothenoylcysteine decarboxylase/phosphopantothenate--cysteine ligase CoaBC [Alphaproteobacteria bacterium]
MTGSPLDGRRILLVISGGIAAYKALILIRRLRDAGAGVRAVLTRAAEHFVTPLSVAALSEDKVYTDLFSLTDESEMGHIRLSREADLVVVAPATADIMARMAGGRADDLATTLLLATDKPVLIAPAMNVRMWEHPATRRNLAILQGDGIQVVGPEAGDLACGEVGAGRMAEPETIFAAIADALAHQGALAGVRALVTSGPTVEAIDPVRFIANRSSGKQGHAVAAALARAGATVTLVSGPTQLPAPPGVTLVAIESAREMLAACQSALPAEVAVCAAAVADWRVASTGAQKLKKAKGAAPTLDLTENPDILATLAAPGPRRPRLVIGFAAETENVVEYAQAKRLAKGCDWILANDVSPASGVFGGEHNRIHVITASGVEDWPAMTKAEIGTRLATRIAAALPRPAR